jgi:hypothetical protein
MFSVLANTSPLRGSHFIASAGCVAGNKLGFMTHSELTTFENAFGIAANRVLWWQRQEEMGNDVLVIVFDNKEKLTLRDEKRIREAEAYLRNWSKISR